MSISQFGLIVAIGLLVFLLFMIILFAGLEFAFFGANRLTIELKRKQTNRTAQLMGSFFEQPERFWSATTISFYIALIAFCLILQKLLSYWIGYLPTVHKDFEYTEIIINWIVASALVVSSISFFSKRIFESYPDGSLSFWARYINFLIQLTSPIANFYVGFSEMILKYLFNIKVPKKQVIFERTDVDLFLHNTVQGHNDDDNLNQELFEKVVQLSQVKVRKCLIPRNEVIALDVKSTSAQLIEAFVQTKYSKIILFEGDIDHVLGYVHHIELGKHPRNIREILHSIPAVPETMNAIDLIHLFTKERKSIAWVVDEFGGTAGVVTMEDILEEIFGDIRDEYDIQEYTESHIGENEYIFSGRLKLEYLESKYHFEFEDDLTETLSGYIIRNYSTIPKQNTKLIINKIEYEILLATPTKIETVKLRVLHS